MYLHAVAIWYIFVPSAMINCMQQSKQKVKKRIFVYIRTDVDAPYLISAVSENEKNFFCREVERTNCRETWFSDNDDTPAARAFAAFEKFCVDECGLTDSNDEVIFATRSDSDEIDVPDYFDAQLGGVPWAVVKVIEFNYKHETLHLDSPLTFEQFAQACDVGLDEPYATKHLYAEYRRLIHKDIYTPRELDRMETYAATHLDEAYLPKGRGFDAVCGISHVCAAAYRSDSARYLRLIDRLVQDFNKRQGTNRRRVFADILSFAADEVADDGYIDYDVLAAEQNKPMLERSWYSMYRAVETEQLKTIKSILEEFEE